MEIAALLALLPELLVTLPKIGEGVYRVLNANRDQLPADQLAALDAVKIRQGVEDAEWDRDLYPSPDVLDARERANERTAAVQAGDDPETDDAPGGDPAGAVVPDGGESQ